MIPTTTLLHGDCLELMKDIPDKSIDAIICDLPYGTTACKWDSIIPLEPLWKEYKRIIKDNRAIVLTASQPFTTKLIGSNYDWFKYEWIWEKDGGSNFATVKYMPMKEHENILVFGKGKILYNEQREERIGSRKGKITKTKDSGRTESVYGTQEGGLEMIVPELRCPRSIQRFTRERGLHPTQKPVALMEYLIKTYTNEGGTVLDNTMGSGTTGVACVNLNRNFIGMELDEGYLNIATNRIQEAKNNKTLF
ncbi:MAG TPA: site-specific DNA-methyltransferase [Epulopiscium sp.]|nr:site-specific DNA-methyltransferase [Candidatus Epulonipiscium sp.]